MESRKPEEDWNGLCEFSWPRVCWKLRQWWELMCQGSAGWTHKVLLQLLLQILLVPLGFSMLSSSGAKLYPSACALGSSWSTPFHIFWETPTVYYKAVLYFSEKRNLCYYLIFYFPLAFKFSSPLQKGVPGKELCLSLCSKRILDLKLLHREWVLHVYKQVLKMDSWFTAWNWGVTEKEV